MVTTHERYVDELTHDFEQKLDDDKQAKLQLEDEKIELERELEEMQRQVRHRFPPFYLLLLLLLSLTLSHSLSPHVCPPIS